MKMRPAKEAVEIGNKPSRTFEKMWDELCRYMDDDQKVKACYDGTFFTVPLFVEYDTNENVILKKKLGDAGYILEKVERRELPQSHEHTVCHTVVFKSAVRNA